MARRACDDDDDCDDIPSSRGRPRAPEEFGPRKPWPHERTEYFRRLQAILDSLEIPDLGRDERLYLQLIMCRSDMLRRADPKRFAAVDGVAHVILILRSIAETTNGHEALRVLIIQALSSCMHKAWTDRGLDWLSAMDEVPLLEIQQTLRGLGLEDQLANAIRWRLIQLLGSPALPKPKPKPKPKTWEKPPNISEKAWTEAVAMYKNKKPKRPKAARAAA
ncbi:hypothetical protein [Bradyrhizobium sp. Cp5.3]|uniref:hypothetical protein n=1 Tax=Bradyrhizobium sp. Cp5.3 TaxID=443598 RepID=UPI0003FD7D8F|nr:hypothetical protein [Bradyrhizobium sp. Cp5.3]